MRAGRLAHDQPSAIHLCCELLHLVDHVTANPLASQIACHHYIVDLNCVVGQLNCDDGNELSDEFTQQATCRDYGRVCLCFQKRRNRFRVCSFDRTNEESLPPHEPILRRACLGRAANNFLTKRCHHVETSPRVPSQ